MSLPPKIVVLDRFQTGESANPSHENILAGIPRTRVSNQYTDASGEFFCGIWTSTAGKWRVRYTEHEFCVIIEGRVRIESVDRREARTEGGRRVRGSRRLRRRVGSQRALQKVVRDFRAEVLTARELPADHSASRITRLRESPYPRSRRCVRSAWAR